MHGLATAMIAAPRSGAPRETACLRLIPSECTDMDAKACAAALVFLGPPRIQVHGQRLPFLDVQLKMWSRSRTEPCRGSKLPGPFVASSRQSVKKT